MPRRNDLHRDPRARLRTDCDRPGLRVRLFRRAGVQGPARGGLRGRPGQLEPGDDHDRPGVRHCDLRGAAPARGRRAGDRARAARRAAAHARRADRAEPGHGLHEDGMLERFGVELIGATVEAI